MSVFNLYILCRSQCEDVPSNLPVEKQSSYIVFESALLLLFHMCIFCRSARCSVNKFVNGSFLRITQTCSKCHRKRVWDSQPFIGNTPAGNLFASAAILYTGSFPAQALRMFRTLKCAMISNSTFFRHQHSYLIPAINTTWERHQNSLFSFLKDTGLVVAGDERADSPGHSAKYGTYSLLELGCNKIVDFKLVQVHVCVAYTLFVIVNSDYIFHYFIE